MEVRGSLRGRVTMSQWKGRRSGKSCPSGGWSMRATIPPRRCSRSGKAGSGPDLYSQTGAQSLEGLSGGVRPATFQSHPSSPGEDQCRTPLRRLLSSSREALVAGPGQAARDLGRTEGSPLPAPAGPPRSRSLATKSGTQGPCVQEVRRAGGSQASRWREAWGDHRGSICGAPRGAWL